MKKFLWLLDHLEEVFLSILLAALSVIMFAQVIMRYVFSSSLSWSEEICRYIFIWIIFFGISDAIRKKAHLRVDILEQFWPKLSKPFEILTDVAFLALSIYMLSPGWQVITKIKASGQHAPASGTPMYIIYVALFCGFIMCIIRTVQKYIQILLNRNKKTDSTIEGEEETV